MRFFTVFLIKIIVFIFLFSVNSFAKSCEVLPKKVSHSNLILKPAAIDSLIRNDIVFYNSDSAAKRKLNTKVVRKINRSLMLIGFGIVVAGVPLINRTPVLARGFAISGLGIMPIGAVTSFKQSRKDDAEIINLLLGKTKNEIRDIFGTPVIDTQKEGYYLMSFISAKQFLGRGKYQKTGTYRYVENKALSKYYEFYFDENEIVIFTRYLSRRSPKKGWTESKRVIIPK
jgi:hypothetical protein